MNNFIFLFFIAIVSGVITLLLYDVHKEELTMAYNKFRGIGDANGVVPKFNTNGIGGII